MGKMGRVGRIGIYPQDNIGGTAVIYANAVSVAPNSFLVAIDKDVGMYLEEDTSLGIYLLLL